MSKYHTVQQALEFLIEIKTPASSAYMMGSHMLSTSGGHLATCSMKSKEP
jgi:hypothetical protein